MAVSLGVLITYFNEGELLTECLDSLWAQTEKPDQVFVYDDASSRPAARYIPEGSPVHLIRGEVNCGPAHARNELLRACAADYIHFHDADDLFHPAWCREVRRAIERTRADAVFTEISSYVEGKLLCEKVSGLDQLSNEQEDLVRFCIRRGMLVPSGTYRRAAVLAIGGYRESAWQSEDYDFHIRLAASGVRHAVLPEPLVRIQIRPSGRSSDRERVWYDALKLIEQLAQEIPDRYRPELANAAARMGTALFQMGARDKAREAFQTASRIGPPDLREKHRFYRWTARMFGLEMTERLGAVYRKVIPERIRRITRGDRPGPAKVVKSKKAYVENSTD